MVKIYGIKNCDTMQKAFKWLETHQIEYAFHNYKTDGITPELIDVWLKNLQPENLINKKGTTYKSLNSDDQKNILNPAYTFEIVARNPSIIKRPLLDFDGKFTLGFSDEQWKGIFAK